MSQAESSKTINALRVFKLNDKNLESSRDYVLYWMQASRRLTSSHALDYAVACANHLNKPLVILEAVRADYPWHCDRFHHFILQGMAEHSADLRARGVTYYPFVERHAKHGKGLVKTLAERACAVVTDFHPCFIFPEQGQKAAAQIECRLVAIDGNGIVPLQLTDKAPYSAYLFRKIWQKHFRTCLQHAPESDGLAALKNSARVNLSDAVLQGWPAAAKELTALPKLIASLPIDHSVPPVALVGTEAAAQKQLKQFLRDGLPRYATERNHPDAKAASGLSPWLHFGKIGAFDILQQTLAEQPANWKPEAISKSNAGKSEGWFGGDPSIDSFLDELISWREVGLHYCHHQPNFDKFESLPDWARKTLQEHTSDPRPMVYSPEALEAAQTHDEIWNAAQRQLVREGVMQNYLRMLWGKKVIEWSKTPQEALAILIHLNNKYALDGRDPNSYSGIFWCFGRFDRPWFERSIFGSIRYMTSESAAKKLHMKKYLVKYGEYS